MYFDVMQKKTEVEITSKTRTQVVNNSALPLEAVVCEYVLCIRVARGRPPVVGALERCNEPACSVMGGEFLGCLMNCLNCPPDGLTCMALVIFKAQPCSKQTLFALLQL